MMMMMVAGYDAEYRRGGGILTSSEEIMNF
jgi:hypothetical protein